MKKSKKGKLDNTTINEEEQAKQILCDPDNEDQVRIVGMKLTPKNWDIEYKKDIESGIGFDIDDPNGINKNNVRSPRGIYSNLYGADISEDSDYQSTYKCKCKDPDKGLKGKFYFDGVTRCPECGQLVERVNNTMERTGWMTLRPELHLINPLYYYMLEKIIGKKNLNNIIFYNKDRDDDGNVIINMDYFDENNPYFNIGLVEFYNKFDEILDFYKDNIKGVPNLRKDKLELCEFLKENKEKIFANHYPVYTLLLRPILMIKNNMVYADINKKYQSLLVNICELNKTDKTMDNKDLKVLPLLYSSQIILNQIHKKTIEEQTSGKEGHIRSNVLGERVNFSSRCVIIPLIGKYQLDEIKLPYLVFLELYKYEIINLLCKLDNLYLNEALIKWNRAVEQFDKRIYLIMKYIVDNTEGGCYCFINRNNCDYKNFLIAG